MAQTSSSMLILSLIVTLSLIAIPWLINHSKCWDIRLLLTCMNHWISPSSYLVNKLDCEISFKPSEELLDLLKKTPHREVIKQGCGTNVTRGTISSSSPQSFVVRSVEASWFCTPGDSGSFILAKDPTADPESRPGKIWMEIIIYQ
jgi:hypothetical protein